VRLWKGPEQSQLGFRSHASDLSTDAVAAINDAWFVSGGADGSLALWHTTKKKPVWHAVGVHGDGHTVPAAPAFGGVAPPAAPAPSAAAPVGAADAAPTNGAVAARDLPALCAATGLTPDARALSAGYCAGVTALAVCPNSDVIASGSGDGYLRLWRLRTAARPGGAGSDSEEDSDAEADGGARARRPVEALLLGGEAMKPTAFTGLSLLAAIPVRGVVNGLAFADNGGLLVAAVGQEPRLGRWWHYRAAKNGLLLVRLPRVSRTAPPPQRQPPGTFRRDK